MMIIESGRRVVIGSGRGMVVGSGRKDGYERWEKGWLLEVGERTVI